MLVFCCCILRFWFAFVCYVFYVLFHVIFLLMFCCFARVVRLLSVCRVVCACLFA